MWFRRDLRLQDNPAFVQACSHEHVLPIWIDDEDDAQDRKSGSALRLWRHHSLVSLKASLNGNLSIFQKSPFDVFSELIQRYKIEGIYWNRCYEPWRISRDTKLKAFLKQQDITTKSFNGSLLWEPWEINKADGTPYRVFTPYFKNGCLSAPPPRNPMPAPKEPNLLEDSHGSDISSTYPLPHMEWQEQLHDHWLISEAGAHKNLKHFIEHGLGAYKEGRNFPAQDHISKLSPYLANGEISANQIWHEIKKLQPTENTAHFCSELGWREFSYNLLSHNPEMHRKNLQKKFDAFPWHDSLDHLQAWQKGQTGIPLVDAGMRELWASGHMHNRVRMVAASFLVKNLLIPWQEGEKWFWDTLVDADPASNTASWQWVAGCGVDAAPYFRIFNPITQGAKFDPTGEYIRKWVPELASLPNKHLFNPSAAPSEVLEKASITLGKDYPKAIVDIKASREKALAAYGIIRDPSKIALS